MRVEMVAEDLPELRPPARLARWLAAPRPLGSSPARIGLGLGPLQPGKTAAPAALA